MNYIEHKELWNSNELVSEYKKYNPILLSSETYLVKKAIQKLDKKKVENILCIGCGTGREVLPMHQSFPQAKIYANDIAANMMEAAMKNFETWEISQFVEPVVCAAEDIPITHPVFDIITCFNNVLNFVTDKQKRDITFSKFFEIMQPGGVLIGMVHNIYGTPQKTAYFLLQKLLAPFRKNEWGDRIAGRKNQKYMAHYFNKNEITNHLLKAGFKNIEVLSLEELYKFSGRKYNRLTGTNNLIFVATK